MKHDVLLSEYRELIHAAVLENEADRKLRTDDSKLHSKLLVIYKAASYDGLEELEVTNLINEFHITKAA